MSSELDVRTRIYCNLGTVISGNLQEGTIVGAGLINVTGNVLLDGVYRILPGSVVELAYYKNGRMTRLGRKLRAISVYANPVTRTTEVELGCKLTMLKDSEPPPQVFSSLDDTDTADLTAIEQLLMVKPTYAKFVAAECCKALGISYAAFPLTNQFYQEEFKISGKYLNTLSDLLISEGYVGYLDGQEVLQVINTSAASGSGPVLDENKIIRIDPITSGDPDADTVYSIVNYRTVKLDDSLTEDTGETTEEIFARNDFSDENDRRKPPYWLKSYVDNGIQVRRFRYEPPKVGSAPSTPIYADILFRSIATRTSEYDSQDRPIRVTEVVQGPWGNHTNLTTTEYFKDGDTEKVVVRAEKRVRNEDAVEACGFPSAVMRPLPSDIRNFASRYNGDYVLEEVTIQTTVAQRTNVTTTQTRSAAAYATSAGAANIQKYIESFTSRYKEKQLPSVFTDEVIDTILNMAIQFVHDKTTVSYSEKPLDTSIITEYKSSYSSVSSGSLPLASDSIDWDSLTPEEKEDLINRGLETGLSGDPENVLTSGTTYRSVEEITDDKNGYTASVVDVPEIIFTTAETGGGIILELTPPYMSDDKVVKVGDYYDVKPSDAREKALSFARIQNRLRYGYRNGQAVVFPVEYTPIKPFSPLYLKFGGVTGQYRFDRLNIVFDSSGILVSTDAIFWGGVGQ